MIRIEHHHGVLQQIIFFQTVHQFSHKLIRFHGMGNGVGVLLHIVFRTFHLVFPNRRFRCRHMRIRYVAEVFGIRSMSGIGDQKTEKRILADHFVIAADHLAVHHIICHVHGVHIVIGFKSQIGMNGAPAVDLPAGRVEGICRISAVAELVGQTQRKGMSGIGIAADPLFGRNQPRLGQDLRIECRR